MSAWPEPRLRRLGDLIDRGLSATQIGAILSVTRDQVCGAAWRRGWRIGEPRRPEQRIPPFKVVRRAYDAGPSRTRPVMGPGERPVRFSVSFDPETHALVSAAAKARGVSRCEIIRIFVEWGLEALQQERDAA